ncbi:MAG: efflux RND transporter periplasmic adaptor subunit [Proteobacteria bacterium]|nr:efflux RND transporter periplasmic adaptor subunit [Pseudomonadota bacterium]
MKFSPTLLLVTLTAVSAFAAAPADDDAARRANLVILDPTTVQNLGLTTVQAAPADFEETIFALGRIDVLPGHRAVVSSRIAGRAVEVRAKHDHAIKAGEVAVVVESRQFGEPPPRIELPAPIDGTVSAVHVVPGQPVEPDAILVEILDLTEVYAIARVPDHLAGRLQRGQKARITAAAAPGRDFEAVLEHLGVTADTTSGTVEAAFRVQNADLVLRPGMRIEFAVITARHSGVTSIPRAAVQGEGGNRFVYVKDFDLPNAFLKTPVVTGRSNDRLVEITHGLFPADEVVTRGAYSLAFAGGGSVSLKEALDAAHGHAHAADGSELTGANSTGDEHGHVHADGETHAHERVWMIVSAVLFLALVFVSAQWRAAARRN